MGNKEESDKCETVSEQEREFALQALKDYNQKKYSSCLQNIAKLESKANEFKILHNKYVVEYAKSDFTKTEQFQRNLSNLLLQFNLRLDTLDDLEHSVAYFNQAVLMYHQKQYTSALNIMDKVYKYIEPMDEEIGRKVGLLLLELYISVRLIDKAIDLITYLHNHALNQTIPTTLNTTKVPEKSKQEKDKKPAPPVTKETEEFVKLLEHYKLRCNLLKRNLNVTHVDLQTLCQYYPDPQIDLMLFAANQQYLEGKFLEAMDTLGSIPKDCLKLKETGESSNIIFNNNIGVIHYAMGKPNLGCFYFQQALREDISNIGKPSERTLHVLGASRYYELMFNLGLSFLQADKPEKAFECLVTAVRRYHRNSRLWLRLAECCISVNKNDNFVDSTNTKRMQDIIAKMVGKGEYRKVILRNSLEKTKKYSASTDAYAVPMTTLDFAYLCLKNAESLIPSDTSSTPIPLLLVHDSTPEPASNLGTSPSSPITPLGIIELTNAIYAASAYVHVCLGDYVGGLMYAKKLLEQEKLSGIHKLLGHLYAAECLLLQDKLDESLEHLNPEHIADISFDIVDERNSKDKTKPPKKPFLNNKGTLMSVIHYNIAAVNAIKGNYEQASALAQKIWNQSTPEMPVPLHVLMLILYVELQCGRIDRARKLLHNSIRR